MENLENEKRIFQTWKNHGIWKKKAKIMEFWHVDHGKIMWESWKIMEFDSGTALETLYKWELYIIDLLIDGTIDC